MSMRMAAITMRRSLPRSRLVLRQLHRGLAGEPAIPAQSTAVQELINTIAGQLWIDGRYCAAQDRATLPVMSPRDGKQLTEIANASAADVNSAVAAARRCFQEGWGDASNVVARTTVLKTLAAAIREPSTMAMLSELESLDCGKPLGEAEGDIGACANYFDYFADIAPNALKTDSLNTGSDEPFAASLAKEAIGVVGCITPWNYPLMQAVLKVAPALAAGCTVVLKPAPNASLACVALGQLAADAGLPSGALNIVTGGPPEVLDAAGNNTGQILVDHADLDKLSFTGSGHAGQAMLIASAAHLRPTSLELGGKSPIVVFDDAREHMAALLDWLMVGIFCTTGQICSATSRLIVQDTLHDELVQHLKRAAAELVVGDPLAPDTQMGPIVSFSQMEKVNAAISNAQAQGATVYAPELRLQSQLAGGYYVPPTIVTDVPLDSDAWIDEIFGPVLCITKFSTEDEAVELANASEYGLAAAVFSSDSRRCASVASKLEAGVVWQNCSQVLFESTPFGGKQGKKSGFGHEMGEAGLLEYINTKTIVAALDGHSWGWYGNVSKPR